MEHARNARSGLALTLGSSLGALGAGLLAALGAVCCLGPLAVSVLGVSGAVAAASLTPYTPYFFAASVAFLGLGFWRAYRKRPTCDARGCRSTRRARAMMWIAATLTLGLYAFVLLGA